MTVTISYATQFVGGDLVGDFQTNTFESADQLAPDALGLSGGGFVCAYNNFQASDGVIVLNFYDADRALIGSHEFANATGDTDAIGQPKLTELANGNVLVVWDDNNTVGADGGPQGSIYTAAGVVVAEDIDLFTPDTSTAFSEIDVAALDNGNFVVSYVLGGDVFYRVFDSTGVQVVTATAVNTVTAGAQADTQITKLSDGAFAVAWTDTGPVEDLIKGRIFEANGAPRTGELFLSPGSGFNTQPSIAPLEGGGFAVVYADTGWGESGGAGAGISLHIVSSTGTVGAPVHVNLDSAGDENGADVTVLSNGFIAVTWTGPNPTSNDILGRVFDQAGNAVTGEFTIAASGDDEIASSVSALFGGMFITSWQDELTDGAGGSIASQVTEITRTTVGDAANDVFRGDALRDAIDGDEGDDKLAGGANDDHLIGGGGNDKVKGQSGDDTIEGFIGSDTLNGGVGDDILFAVSEAGVSFDLDFLNGANGHDTLFGSAGAESLIGLAGKDVMEGRDGNDTMVGGSAKDLLTGGLNADQLTGGSDKDTFVFNSVSDSANGAEDLITDLGNQDFVDLSGIDAKTVNPGDQAFTLVAAFGGNRGELVVTFHTTGVYNGFTTIQGDVDGDAAADFTIKVNGDKHVFDNFML